MRTVRAEQAPSEPSAPNVPPEPKAPPEQGTGASERGAEGQVQALRRRLLDLRTVTRLIHFPHAERGKSYVRVVDDVPELLHKKLVAGRALRILPLPATLAEPERGDEAAPADEVDGLEVIPSDELALAADGESVQGPWGAQRAARLLGIDPSFALPEAREDAPPRGRGDGIQTLLYPELHQETLANIADLARSAREEQGIHTLFAAFGFLEWYERLDSDLPRFAPLVLHPLALTRERKPGAYHYTVSAHAEEHEINPALDERLLRDFGLRLPAWEEDDDLGAYFARVRAAVACQPRWKLHRWVTLGNFSFARIAMYHDLDAERWPAGQAPHVHPTFRLLTSVRAPGPQAALGDDEDERLVTLADELPTLVLDADTSQVAAVLAAMEPRNLVIQGPPGTGKSQTIANLIAAALGAGQRVLFVAEKLAALEVVKARLDRAGLGPFCLELHADRATRKAVMDALSQRLLLDERPPAKLEAQRERAQALRAALNAHAAALNQPYGTLGYSVHELIWRRERARRALGAALPALETLRVPGALSVRLEELDQVRHTLAGLTQAAQDRDRAFLDDVDSIWRTFAEAAPEEQGATKDGAAPHGRAPAAFAPPREGLEEELLARLEAYQGPLMKLCAALRRRLGSEAEHQLSVRQLSALRSLARELPKHAAFDAQLLSRLEPANAEALRGTLALLRGRAALLEQIQPRCADPVAAQAALAELRAALPVLARWTAETPEGGAVTLAASEARAAARVRLCDELVQLGEHAAELAIYAGLVNASARAVGVSERKAMGVPATADARVRAAAGAPGSPEPGRASGTFGKRPVPLPSLNSSEPPARSSTTSGSPPARAGLEPRLALDDAESVLVLRDTLAALGAAPRAQLELLRAAPGMAEEGALAALHALREEAAALRARRGASQRQLDPGREAAELRARGAQYVLSLRRPGWLAWVFSSFWAARRLYARIARMPARSARQMADQLLEATRMLEAVEQFEAREDLRALAGRAFAGLDTDFDLLVQAAEWAREMRRTYAGLHPAKRALQRLLLHDPLERVDTLLAEADGQPFSELWALAERAQQRAEPLSAVLASERRAARNAQRVLARLRQLGLSDALPLAELPNLIEALAALGDTDAKLDVRAPRLTPLGLGRELRDLPTEALAHTLHAFDRTQPLGVPKAIVQALAMPEARLAFAKQAGSALTAEARERAALSTLGLGEERWPALSAPLAEVLDAVGRALETRRLLRAQLRFLRTLSRAEDTCAAGIVAAAARGQLPFDRLVDALEFLLYHELVERACEERPALAARNGRELDSMRRQFQTLDRQLLSLQAKAIAAALSRAEVPEGVASGKKSEWSELALIHNELSKKQRHIPLRQLLRRAPLALRALKPCFMMSPLTVAQYLPQEPDQFDVVIIDEASQMRPEDALGAIVRAKRAVVVGDSKQLPPTAFFRRLEGHDETHHEEPEDDAIEQESILDLGVASFGATRDLRWHYRSRHPSLIAFSNRHFYDGRLKVFPAPRLDGSGVQLICVDGAYAASRNPREAEQIVLGVCEHARRFPHLSLGVVAMNQPQKELIQQKLYALDDDALRTFMDAAHPAQPFFVKNLENVQGDERDVIFVSMTYGPDPKTKRVAQRFGPLNGPHGARRLNVLFTRARERLVVYSSLRPDDVRVDDASSPGLGTLRDYLVYASHSEPTSLVHAGQVESAFERAVRAVLEQAGYQVVPRVGVHGFFIDLGVCAPDGGGFACGIECDGPLYHAQRSTRDRDRLRQEVLESQGWTLVRVWSTDWFRAPDAARERLLAKVRALCGRPRERAGSATASP